MSKPAVIIDIDVIDMIAIGNLVSQFALDKFEVIIYDIQLLLVFSSVEALDDFKDWYRKMGGNIIGE